MMAMGVFWSRELVGFGSREFSGFILRHLHTDSGVRRFPPNTVICSTKQKYQSRALSLYIVVFDVVVFDVVLRRA
jgi:hypothetical protein